MLQNNLRRLRSDLASRLRHRQRTLKSRLAKAETQLALTRAAQETFDPHAIGALLVDRATEWLQASACAVLVPGPNGEMRILAGRGLAGGLADVVVGVTRWVIRHPRHFASADLRRDARVTGPCGAVLAFPLVGRKGAIGALILLDRQASTIEPPVSGPLAEVFVSVLHGPGLALESALMLERAEALSVTDDLTQLYNSRYLNQVLRREAKRASRSGRPLSLLFLDLDGFKYVNDSHGHLAGSAALVEAAALIRGSARETDVVARFGGDEFALILPDTGSDGAAAVAERVRERIAGHVFLQQDGLNIRLTVSIGVATLPDVAGSAEQLVNAADAAMYRIKGTGKNGVFIAASSVAAI